MQLGSAAQQKHSGTLARPPKTRLLVETRLWVFFLASPDDFNTLPRWRNRSPEFAYIYSLYYLAGREVGEVGG